MILGKFMPPHLGHQLLIDFGRSHCDRLTVLCCSLQSEPIPGELRRRWLSEMFPGLDIVHVAEEVPQEPSEHPDFWDIWQDLVRRHVPGPVDFVYASEDYGHKLAEVLGAEFVPVDISRDIVPVSGRAVRDDPMANWRFIPPAVRPHYVKRVCLLGPESTGKSTLARELARAYDTVFAGEYARGLLDPKGGRCAYEDIGRIALGQPALEDAMARQANRVLFCDTDLVLTTIWSEVLFGACPDWVRARAESRQYDLYLLLGVDVPWVDDNQRFLPHLREEFLARCKAELDKRGRPYTVIGGGWEDRLARAREAVDILLGGKM